MDGLESNSYKRQQTSNSEKDLVECSNASRGVWLVKVPKYISSLWEKAPPLSEAGRLRIATSSMGKPDIKFSLSDEMLKYQDSNAKTTIPKEHRFSISNITHQTLAVFSQPGTSENRDSSSNDSGPGKITLQGHVLQKGECRPLPNQSYMDLKRDAIMKAREPERKVKQLKKVVTNYKPVSNHQFNIEYEQKKKAEGKKARDDKDKVMEILFSAFEKHQYYNIKDLEKITRQPVPYLKEILKEICNYNAKNPHKSMWELKPEYRHYKAEHESD